MSVATLPPCFQVFPFPGTAPPGPLPVNMTTLSMSIRGNNQPAKVLNPVLLLLVSQGLLLFLSTLIEVLDGAKSTALRGQPNMIWQLLINDFQNGSHTCGISEVKPIVRTTPLRSKFVFFLHLARKQGVWCACHFKQKQLCGVPRCLIVMILQTRHRLRKPPSILGTKLTDATFRTVLYTARNLRLTDVLVALGSGWLPNLLGILGLALQGQVGHLLLQRLIVLGARRDSCCPCPPWSRPPCRGSPSS